MENRYLFKAKRKNWQELPKDEQWVQGYLFDDGFENGRVFVGSFVIEKYNGTACDDWAVTGINFYEIDQNTICQCTGLKDKNGELIWENDIVRDKEGNCYKAFWQNNYYQFSWICVKSDIFQIGTKWDLYIWRSYEIAVIGNTFDNPELLESEE
jgi:uncharacterized phage protein (TIGR01671 family)|nr:MAG TPA: YopX protein [Caudoviricetes sp.]